MDFKKPIPEGEAYYMDDDGNVITESDFIAEFIKKCDYKYTPDERLDKLMNNIPDVIAKFDTFTQDEVFRSKVKDSDGSLNSILDRTAPENRYGCHIYKPFACNDRDKYKEEFFTLLSYCLVFYVTYYEGTVYNFNLSGTSGKDFGVSLQSLPHLLGLENAYVSSRPNNLLESIIPGYNSQKTVLDKMLYLIQNADKIIKYERDHNVDLFNYCKCKSKCKSFLMSGRILADSDSKLNGKNKFAVLPYSTRDGRQQFHLLKKSNMNQVCDNNVCKIILEEDQKGSIFVKSLQGFTDQLLRSTEYRELLKKSPTMVTKNGVMASMSCNTANQIKITVIKNGKHYDLAERYPTPLAPPPIFLDNEDDDIPVILEKNENYDAVCDFLNFFGVEVEGLEEYKYVRKYKDSSNNSENTSDTTAVSVASANALSVVPNAQTTVVSSSIDISATKVNSSDDIEILLDEEEDFDANFDKYLQEMLDEAFDEIGYSSNNSVKKM